MTVQELIDILQQVPDKDIRQVITGGFAEGLQIAEQVLTENIGGIGSRLSFEEIPTLRLLPWHTFRQEYLKDSDKLYAPPRPLTR